MFKEEVVGNGETPRTGTVLEEPVNKEQFREWMQVTRRSRRLQNKKAKKFPKADNNGSRFVILGKDSIYVIEKEIMIPIFVIMSTPV